MHSTIVIRVVALYGPAMLVVLSWLVHPPSRARAAGALLAFAWNLPALLLVNVLAIRLGWWTFAPSPARLAGVPMDLLLGWTLLWGAAPVLLAPRVHLLVVTSILATADLLLMPLAFPVVALSGSWFVGEIVALVIALVPSQLLARWTETGAKVEIRAALQVVAFGATLLWVLPAAIFEYVGGSWSRLLDASHSYGGVLVQLAAVPALLGVSAAQEFATRGRGTPIPYDPPRRLVTTGPYAYVANPMQLSMTLVLVAWGAILASVWVALAGVMAVIYSVGVAEPDEHVDLDARFGGAWRSYRRSVRAWMPRWRPYHVPAAEGSETSVARLYVAGGCDRCAEVARWFVARRPTGLEIVPAENHPHRDLYRITYDPCDGEGDGEQEGVAAFARALEHVHLGWAMVGFFIRLPGISQVLQLLVDVSGGEARIVRRGQSSHTILRHGHHLPRSGP